MSAKQQIAEHKARVDAARDHLDEHFASGGRRDRLYPDATRADQVMPIQGVVDRHKNGIVDAQPTSGRMKTSMRGLKP